MSGVREDNGTLQVRSDETDEEETLVMINEIRQLEMGGGIGDLEAQADHVDAARGVGGHGRQRLDVRDPLPRRRHGFQSVGTQGGGGHWFEHRYGPELLHVVGPGRVRYYFGLDNPRFDIVGGQIAGITTAAVLQGAMFLVENNLAESVYARAMSEAYEEFEALDGRLFSVDLETGTMLELVD